MSKSTMMMLGLFVALGIGWFFSNDKPAKAEFPAVVVRGFVPKDLSLQDVKILNKDDDAPYRRWEVKRRGETYILERLPGQGGKKHSEARWQATRIYVSGKKKDGGEKKTVVKGETYRVRMYAQTLARSFRSNYAFKATENELADYGLDKEHVVEFKATGGGRTVHLLVGKVDRPTRNPGDDATKSSTWVMRPDVEGVVYQVSGHDLRANIDVPWKDVRDRKLLDIEVPRIDKIVVENPADPLTRRFVVKRDPLPSNQSEKLAKMKKASKDERDRLEKELRKSNEGWKIVEPKGYLAGEVGSWLESIERMALTEVVDTPDGRAPAKSELEDSTKARHITLYWGDRKVGFRMGARLHEGEKDVWVALDSYKDSVYRVAGWSADQIDKMLDDIRDTKLFGKDNAGTVKAADNLVVDSPSGRFAARLADGKWIARGVRADSKKISDFINDLAGLDVDYESGKTASEVGLDHPEWRIRLAAKGRMFTVALAAKKGEDYFGRVGDDGNVFKLQSWNADRLRKSGDDLKDKHLVIGLKKADIASITVPGEEGRTARLVRDGGAWKLQAGGEAKVKVKGPAIDRLAASITEAVYDKEIAGKTLAELGLDAPEHTLAFRLSDRRRFELRFSKQSKDGSPYVALLSGNKRILVGTMSSFGAGNLKKKLADLQQ